MTAVSRDTSAQPACPKRRYVSGFRAKQRETTRAALIAAVLASIGEGCWRPRAWDIARRAGCDKAAINHHFGALHLLYRVVARECTAEVLCSIGVALEAPTDAAQRDLAWIVMTGERRPRT